MTPNLPRAIQEISYEQAAQAYLRSLPLEHFMEATAQAQQRRVTLASLELLEHRRSDVHIFNELLVQYPLRGQRKLGQVVPDNMVVLTEERIRASSSFNVPLEPAPPFWVMEYVSQGNPRKDYEDSFAKYERELKVPYYLIFYPDGQELTLYRRNRRKYVSVKPNEAGRLPIPELDLEVGLLDGWVRFWHQGVLLPLPSELEEELETVRRQIEESRRRADEEKRRADEEKRRADEEKRRADEEKRRADEEKRRADEAQHRFDEETLLVEDLQRQLEAAKRQLAKLGH
jgi:Uma2 family endonuclease